MAKKNIIKSFVNQELKKQSFYKKNDSEKIDILRGVKKKLQSKKRSKSINKTEVDLQIRRVNLSIEKITDNQKINNISNEQSNRCAKLRKQRDKKYNRAKYLEKKESSDNISEKELFEYYDLQSELNILRKNIKRCKKSYFKLENEYALVDKKIQKTINKIKKTKSEKERDSLSKEQRSLIKKRASISKQLEEFGEVIVQRKRAIKDAPLDEPTQSDLQAFYTIWDFRNKVTEQLEGGLYEEVITPFDTIDAKNLDELEDELRFTQAQMENEQEDRNLDYKVEVRYLISEKKIIIYFDDSGLDDSTLRKQESLQTKIDNVLQSDATVEVKRYFNTMKFIIDNL